MFFVYVLLSQRTGRYYVGSTKDVARRLREHNASASLSTRAGVPWEVIHVVQCATRSEAVILENRIKARGIRRYLEDMIKLPGR